MTDYDKAREIEHARTAEIRAKIVAAAAVLKFTAEAPDPDCKYDCRVHIRNAAGEEIYLYTIAYDKWRVKVSGNYPRNADGSWPGAVYATNEERGTHDVPGTGIPGLDIAQYGEISSPSITISPDKTPEVIARDIERRFLPAYREYLRRLMVVINAHNDYEMITAASLETLKGAALTEYEIKDRKFNMDGRKVKGQDYTPCANVRASREDITLEIRSLTIDQARRILAVIK
jgi:hypothetical protein